MPRPAAPPPKSSAVPRASTSAAAAAEPGEASSADDGETRPQPVSRTVRPGMDTDPTFGPDTTIRSALFKDLHSERIVARTPRYPDPLPGERSGMSTIRGQGHWGPADEQRLRAAWVQDPP